MLFHRRQNTQVALHSSGIVIADVMINHLDEFLHTGKTPTVIAFPLRKHITFEDMSRFLRKWKKLFLRFFGKGSPVSAWGNAALGQKYPVKGTLAFKSAIVTNLSNGRVGTKKGALGVPDTELIDIVPKANV